MLNGEQLRQSSERPDLERDGKLKGLSGLYNFNSNAKQTSESVKISQNQKIT